MDPPATTVVPNSASPAKKASYFARVAGALSVARVAVLVLLVIAVIFLARRYGWLGSGDSGGSSLKLAPDDETARLIAKINGEAA